MFQRLATSLRDQLSPLIAQYDERLRAVPGYANLPELARHDLERRVLQLVADCLEANDDSPLIQYVHDRAEQVLAQGFQPEWFQQAVSIPQEILIAQVETVEESNFVWRALGRAQATAWEIVARERHRIELMLRENEARYQTIFDATPIMFWLKDTHNRTLRINKAAAEFEGVKQADVEGKSAYDLYPHAQAEAFYQDDLEVIRSNQPKLGIVEQHTLVGSGKLMWVETGKTPVHDDQGQVVGVLAFGIDVTERQQAEDLLRHSADRQQQTSLQLRAALDAASELIQIQDLDTLYRRSVELAREKLNIERCGLYLIGESRDDLWGTYGTDHQRRTTNEHAAQRTTKEFAAILGASPEQLWIVRETPHTFVDDGAQHTVGSGWVAATVLRGAAGPLGILFNDCALSGQPVDPAQQESLAVYCSILGSIIERQLAEVKLRESEEQYRKAITAAGAVPYSIDYTTESYRFIGEAIEKLIGYKAEEVTPILLGQLIKETAMTGQGRDLSREKAIQQARAGDLVGWNADYHLVDRSGQAHWLNDSSVQILNEQGNPIGAIGILQDITERKRLEEQIQESLARRSSQVQTSTEVAQEIAAATDLNELFKRVVTLIKERFNYYHAQLFRYDPAQDAVVLIEGYGEVGRKMREAGHQLAIGTGVVGTAASTGLSILATDVAQDSDWRPNPNLPETRGELAVPIKWRDEVLGILDVQSQYANALNDDDRLLLEGLCGQIAIAMESKRLLDTVQQSEQLRRTLIDAIPAYIYAKDLEGRHILGNAALMQLYGLSSQAELLGRTDFDFYARELAEQYQASELPILRDGQSLLAHEEPNVGADGQPRWNSTTKVPLRDPQGQIIGLVGITSDITERKQAEIDLRKFKLGLDRSTAAIFMTDMSGVITYVNPAFEKIYGFTPGEAIGQTPRILKSGLIPQEQYQHFWQMLLSGQTVAGEIINKAKDGRLIPVQGSNSSIQDERGNILGFLALHNDITERKRAEEVLRRSEAELSTALQIAKLGYWEYDVEKDLFLFNDHFYSIFHTTAEREGGYQLSSAQYAQKFVYPDDLPVVGSEIERALNSTDRHYSRQLEHRILYADGGVGYISVSINIDRDEQGLILRYYGANQDITQQKLAEQEFSRFKQGLEQASDAVFMTDVNGGIIYVNPAFEKIYGYSREEVLGKTPRILKSGQLSQEFYQGFWQALLNKQSVSGEKPNKTRDGRVIIVEDSNSPVLDSSGTLLGFLSTHRDITERKQAQAELEKFKLGLERSNSAIFITDAQGVISYVNPAFEKIYGYTREEAIGQTPRIIKSGLVPPDQYKQFWSTLLQGQTVAGEIINKAKDGRLIPIDGSNNPILDQSGNVVGFLGMHTDISERKRSEQQMEETLHETERLYAAVSHESWQAYRQTGKLGEGYVFDQTLIQAAGTVWEPEIALALKQHALVASRSEQRAVAVSPLSVRGETIGALGVYDDPAHPLSKEDLQLIEAVSEQVALALESARLFDQNQRDAEREHAINRVTGRIRNARSVDEVLTIATQELRRATHASRSMVEILPAKDQPAGNGNGDGVKA